MDYVLPAAAALVAILLVPGWSFYFDVTPKVVVLLAAAAVAMIGLGFPRSKWMMRIVAFQAAAVILATLFSTHRWVSVYGSTWRRSGLFAELAILVFAIGATQVRDLRGWLRITVLASIPIALYAMLQYFGIDPILSARGYQFGEGKYMIVRPPATLGHAAYLATYLLYVIFAGAELARRESTGLWRAAAITASALAFFAMALSGTRAALVGFAAGALFVALRDRVNRKALYAGVAMLAAIAMFYVTPWGERLRARVFWSSEDALGGARLMLWRDTLRMSAGRPVSGFGPETFSMEFPRHQSVELARAYPDFYHESAHNVFLDALVSKGLLGLLAMLAAAAFGIAIARGFLGAALVAMLVSQQFTAFTVPTELYFFLTLGMLAADPKASMAAAFKPLRIGAAVLFAGFAVYLAAGDVLLGSARRAIDHGEIDRAATFVDRARQWNASADFYFSRRFAALNGLRSWQYGFAAAARATETADDPQNAWINLAAFQAGTNDAHAVERSLRSDIEIAPNWFKPHWLLAQVLQQQGRLGEARAEATLAADRDGAKHPEVAATLHHLR